MRQSSEKYCRICFESEQYPSLLISPCSCRGSSLYIHVHCLELWQHLSLQNNAPHKAEKCSICHAYFRYPSMLIRILRRWKYYLTAQYNYWIQAVEYYATSIVVEPFRFCISAMLSCLLCIYGSIEIMNEPKAVALVDDTFPSTLSFIHQKSSSNTLGMILFKGIPNLHHPKLQPGTILLSTSMLPSDSIFAKTVILLLQHSEHSGSTGVILHSAAHSAPTQPSSLLARSSSHPERYHHATSVRYGGPNEKYTFLLLHRTPLPFLTTLQQIPILGKDISGRDMCNVGEACRPWMVSIAEISWNKLSSLLQIFLPVDDKDVWIWQGKCAWQVHQLEGEIEVGLWKVVPASVFVNDYEEILSTAAKRRTSEQQEELLIVQSYSSTTTASVQVLEEEEENEDSNLWARLNQPCAATSMMGVYG